MDTDHKKDEETIYHAAAERSVAERAAYLRETCKGDPALLARVETLLESRDEAGDFLQAPVLDISAKLEESSLTEGPGTVIGRYKLLEKIGEGGMAVVYMAEQETPIRRKVALKIIKLGMDTKSVIARFEAERQALAMMDHPNIAKVFDAGATETGRPYFVMELVTGVSITEYCDKNNLSTKERLALFIQVCNAVQHAHQKGIIHRDIKPTNVMVTLHDGKPVPKVIDFGIAKAINQKLTEKTLFTRYAHIIGTPVYMSPEQAELNELDIDTRSDIYSLGVLLYELLTGTTPFSEKELRKAGYIEMQRVIREQEPPKPSTKLSTLGDTLTDIAKHRSATPDILRKTIRGDLDWIVMKSLEKDRTRRYETASMLALDIRHHLENEPVIARGPATTYRMQKFLRRHRSQTIATLAILIIAAAAVVILSMWNQDRLQLAEAEGFRHRSILSQAREQYAKADRDTALETIKPILNSKYVGPEARLLNAGILIDNRHSDEAVIILSNLLNERPEIAGAAHSLLARILYESESPNADTLKQAEQHHQKAEMLLPDTAEAYFLRAMFAITVKEQFRALNKALQLDLQHYESRRLRAYTYYASRKYDKMSDDALVMEILRPRDPLGHSLRAIALRELGKYEQAIAEYDNAIALTDKSESRYIDLSVERCQTLLRMGDYEHVITDSKEGLKISPDKPVFQYYIFSAMTALGDYEKADSVFREIVQRTPTARNEFRQWCAKYIFDTLDAGRSWYPDGMEPVGASFLPMVEAEETYRSLSGKAHRLTTDGFTACWSPDCKKLAFSAGVHGYSGVALYDPATKETELLIIPGKDPLWSPDGKYIAFIRDCQLLRISEFIATERKEQHRHMADEEVWIMNADGTEPRRLACGGWPTWSQDSSTIYYQSRVDNKLCSISITGGTVEQKQIMACSNPFPSLSPDNRFVAYLESASLKVKDLTSKTVVAEWPAPFSIWSRAVWYPTGRELCLAGQNSSDDMTGLWIYDLHRSEPERILGGQITVGSWSSDGSKLVFSLGPPYFEIWAADLDPNVSTIEALGPAQTPDEHIQEMLAFYNRRIGFDPQDAYAYSDRARYYDYLHDQTEVNANMRRWSAIVSGKSPSHFQNVTARNIRRVINMPFNRQIVFSAERPVNNIPLLNIALEQKGRCNMKTIQMPILTMSLLGLCLLSGLDAPPARADFTFGEPTNLGPAINSSAGEWASCLSADGLELYFTRENGALADIWVARRASLDSEWEPAVSIGAPINSAESGEPFLTADGLTLLFSGNRPGTHGSADLWLTTRATKSDTWDPPANLGATVNSSAEEWGPSLSADGLELYFVSNRPGGSGGYDLWMSTRARVNDNWGAAINMGPSLNTPYNDTFPSISPDGLVLFFASTRPGGFGVMSLYMAGRATTRDPWGEPVNLGPTVNSAAIDNGTKISSDGSLLLFFSNRSGGIGSYDVWQAPILPIVDFNGDGIVDVADVFIMLEHWQTNHPLCDIGPMPLGDGVVDVRDLEVLIKYIEPIDHTLIAHWELEEIEGNIAHDSAVGDNDADVFGDPTWQPDGGKAGGALQFDGVDDYLSTPFILNPSGVSFSATAWIKGGTSGQVIISQADVEGQSATESGSAWLGISPSDGKLMTGLMSIFFGTLESESVVADEQWHHVGLVYDFNAMKRHLYVDGTEVAVDDGVVAGVQSTAGLYIGAGQTLDVGTFFSGLIDDVRIYNKALSAEEITALAQ
jgi:serine/threonine protein kinase/Tol biopolymer transport system component